jgi:hypothetical protein
MVIQPVPAPTEFATAKSPPAESVATKSTADPTPIESAATADPTPVESFAEPLHSAPGAAQTEIASLYNLII